MTKRIAMCVVTAALAAGAQMSLAQTQTQAHGAVSTPASGGNSFAGPGSVVYPPHRDPLERRIDMFIGDWRGSLPRVQYGSLILRDILSVGSNYDPPQKGAVLEGANFVAYGRLPAGNVTVPTTLKGNQEVFYVMEGKGEITAGGKTVQLHKDIAILMPEGLEFMMKASDGADITMYVIDEPTSPGFKPRKDMGAVDEETVEIRKPLEDSPYTLPGASGHWAHVVRDLFNRQDGMASVGDVITVQIDPLRMGEPHPHRPAQEEIWVALDGESLMFLGNELRIQEPGQGFMVRPDNLSMHSNINYGEKPVKFLWFSGSAIRK